MTDYRLSDRIEFRKNKSPWQ